MSLLDQPIAGSNLPEYTVAELSSQLKRSVEEQFGHVRVRGEISQPKLHTSGHLYFTLKDENANLAAVCWRGQVGRSLAPCSTARHGIRYRPPTTYGLAWPIALRGLMDH